MAIINFSTEPGPGRVVSEQYTRETGRPLYVWEEFKGLCLREREQNGYHDSDFFMLVWDESKGEPREIMFASTRGWTYPAMASYVDATPETIAKFEAWKTREDRKDQARRIRGARTVASKVAGELSKAAGVPVSRARVIALQVALSDVAWQFEAVVKCATSTRLRNDFKKSLQAQILAWVKDPAPKFNRPLSPKQLGALNPWRFRTVYRNGYQYASYSADHRPVANKSLLETLAERSR